jgi:hypothetical protein
MAVLWWAVVGALGAFTLAALASIGVFVLPVVLVLGAVGLWSSRLRQGVLPGLLLGAALVPLWLAFTNRSGPGTVCETTATSQSCADQWSPWPFLVVGLLLAGTGAALVHRSMRERAPTGAVHDNVPGPA